jgi:hypothetical protein
MESYISLQDVATIVTFIAPGFFAVKTYGAVYTKSDREFSQLLILSIVCSLPIVSAYNYLLRTHATTTSTRAGYVLGLIAFSIAVGFLTAWIRRIRLVRRVTKLLGLPQPDEDFIKFQFAKLSKNEVVTVKLRSGELFSGTPQGGSSYQDGSSRQYYFNNVAWFSKERSEWDDAPGSIIISMGDIEYIETNAILSDD